MSHKKLLLFIIIIDVVFLLYSLSTLSISYLEATVFFNDTSLLHHIVTTSCLIFGQNEWALRLPFLFLHVLSVLLIYSISKSYVRNDFERIFSVIVYVLLPGANAAALVVNEASLAIFITLLFVCLWHEKKYILSYVLLFFSLIIDNSFIILYIALMFYGYFRKKKLLLGLAFTLCCISFYMYGFDTHGKPKGYFLDTLGIYAATLSPLLFLYYIYALYRITIKERKTLLWFIVFVAFSFSFVFSLRQRLLLEDFLPFAVISTPLMVRAFFNSYRVRLPRFRKMHHMLLIVVMGLLFVNFIATVNNKVLYIFYEHPQKHFAFKHHVAKELATWLHNKNIYSIHVKSNKLALRLKFYGIQDSSKKKLIRVNSYENSDDTFSLFYFSKHIASYQVVDM